MSADDYYTLTALPTLDPPGAAPPIALPDFLARVPAGTASRLVRTLLLGEDLLLREAVHAGELRAADPVVLTPGQVAGEEPLPAELTPAEAAAPEHDGAARALPADALWDAYYRHAAGVATARRSEFLRQWVATEVRLRNELARLRARALGLQPAGYVVARELESSGAAVEPALTAWQSARDPLSGLRALLTARWRWIEQQEPLFTFSTDEYVAYAAKLALLHRWQRSAAVPPALAAPGGSSR